MKKIKYIDAMEQLRKRKDYALLMAEAKFKINFGIEVYNKRIKLKLSQSDLAKKIGSSQKTISWIENGDENMSLELLIRLFKELKFNKNNLLRIFNL
jgi:DNA-binding XRE family transcriptional regulator